MHEKWSTCGYGHKEGYVYVYMCACVSCLSSLLTHSQSHYHTNLLLAHQPSDTNTNTTTTGTWEAATDLVGHEQPSQCVCFAPQIKVSRPLAADADADADANADRDAVAVTSASAVESASASAVTVTPVCTVAMGDALGVVSLWASDRITRITGGALGPGSGVPDTV